MRALHVIPSVSQKSGGPGHAIIEMCRALHERSVDVLVAATDADVRGRLSVELGRPLMYKGVRTIFFPRQWSDAYKYSRPLSRWLDTRVADYDIVHIHAVFSHSSLAAARACRRHGVPYLVRPLGSLAPWGMRQKPFRKKLFWHAGVKRMLRGAAAIHYTTALEKQAVEESLGLARGVVIPLGIESESLAQAGVNGLFRQEHSTLLENPYILVLSRLLPTKGLDVLLEAFLPLVKREEFKSWRLVLAGEGPADYVASLKRLTAEGGGSDHVLFPGWLEGARKISATQGASLLALPSFHENFGLCVMEALACGVPVLVSPHVNIAPEIKDANAGWISPVEKSSLHAALTEALRAKDERTRRGSAGRELARRFSWREIAADLINLYQSIASRERHGDVH